jgi:hypothetical protein
MIEDGVVDIMVLWGMKYDKKRMNVLLCVCVCVICDMELARTENEGSPTIWRLTLRQQDKGQTSRTSFPQ